MKKIFFFMFLFLLPFCTLFAQEGPEAPEGTIPGEEFIPTYDQGDQMFFFTGGLFVPLFFNFSDGTAVSAENQLTLGGMGSLKWSAFLNGKMSLGVELAGTFAFTPNKYVHAVIPITAEFMYFFRKYPLEFPIGIGAGLAFNKLEDQLYFGPILKPGASIYWNITPQWALGFNLKYWWVPEFYFDERPSAFGNFLEASISGLYHF